MKTLGKSGVIRAFFLLAASGLVLTDASAAQQKGISSPSHAEANPAVQGSHGFNRRLQEAVRELTIPQQNSTADYQIGGEDLLDISILGAPELNRTVRVSEDGKITLPLIGSVRAVGLSSGELETELERLLRKNYLTNPHVTVFVREIRSHAVSVIGAVVKPGVYQIRGSKSLIEILAMAQGLADDAGDTVIVMHHGMSASSAAADFPDPISAAAPDMPASSAKHVATRDLSMEANGELSIEVELNDLMGFSDGSSNVTINPGDIVKVPRAGIVYVVGEVHKPGGFLLKTNENISVLQALALAEGLTRTSAARHARIIRTDEAMGARTELPIDLGKILRGQAPDPLLRAKDIVFVPNSAGKSAFYRGTEAALSIAGGVIIYRR